MQCNFSDDEVETLQLVVADAVRTAEETYKQIMTDRIHEDATDFLATMADADRTIKDLKRIAEEVNK